MIFGVPIIDTSHDNIRKKIKNLQYELYCIQHRLFKKELSFFNEKIENLVVRAANFFVKATLRPDIYELLLMNDGCIEKHNIACIPDYKTSVFMNSLFRNVRENSNLDYIEESEDEDMFENIDLDKFVYLDKKIKMKCMYVQKMKLWKPIEISDQPLSNKKYIYMIEKK